MHKALLLCLALNIYYESRGEPEIGQIAVAHVTQNRVNKNNSNICKEVFKKNQFSWTRKSYRIPPSSDPAWQKSLAIANTFKTHKDPTGGCLYFSGQEIKMNRRQVKQIGNHRFYR